MDRDVQKLLGNAISEQTRGEQVAGPYMEDMEPAVQAFEIVRECFLSVLVGQVTHCYEFFLGVSCVLFMGREDLLHLHYFREIALNDVFDFPSLQVQHAVDSALRSAVVGSHEVRGQHAHCERRIIRCDFLYSILQFR